MGSHPYGIQSDGMFFEKSRQRYTDDAPVEHDRHLRCSRFSSLPPVAFYFVRASILNTLNEDIPAEISHGYPTGGGELSPQNPPGANENGVGSVAAKVSSRIASIYSHVERTD